MVAKRLPGNHQAIFSRWLQNDDLATTKSFFNDGHEMDNLAITRLFSWDGLEMDYLVVARSLLKGRFLL